MKKSVKISLIVVFSLLIFLTATVFICIGIVMGINKNVVFDKNLITKNTSKVEVFDNNLEKVEFVSAQNSITFETLPNYVTESFISIEDKGFYKHKGLDYKRIVKAGINNFKSGSFKEGASTISQQLIKNTHLSSEKTLKRKIQEMHLAKRLEKQLSKKEIMEGYLNVIYFGEGCYGIENAANHYFNKSANELSLSEAAVLAGIIKSPAKYSPTYNLENCKKRRNLVLTEMLKDNKITKNEYDKAVNENIVVSETKNENINKLYISAALSEAKELLNLSEKDISNSGIKIYTYLDIEKQITLKNILENEDNYHKNQYGNISDSLSVIINNESAGIEAYYGKSKYNLVDFNRQPGSAIKPILVYAPAIDNGFISPVTQILDEKTDFNGYKPGNVGEKYYGYVSTTTAVSKSLNVPAVKIMNSLGVENCKNFAKLAGIEFSPVDNGLAISLGGFNTGISLTQLTNSYLPFSNSGNFTKAQFVSKIVDNVGKTLYENKANQKQIMGNDTAYLMTEMLIDGVQNGTSARLKNLNYDVAGKTGTVAIPGTNNNTDAISIAYTTSHTMGVWFGNYSGEKECALEGANNGGTYATSVIKLAFDEIYKSKKPEKFKKPESVELCSINLIELNENHVVKLADISCPERYTIKANLAKRFLPTEKSNLFTELTVNNFNVKVENNNTTITFDAKDFFRYELYRTDNKNNVKLLETFEDKKGGMIYYDNNLAFGKEYTYYINIYNDKAGLFEISNKIKIITENKNDVFEKVIEEISVKQNNNKNEKASDLSWYFQSSF